MNDSDITALVTRLGRPHLSGGVTIERAAIQAAGTDYPAVIDWILAHSGAPEGPKVSVRATGLHGSRINGGGDPNPRQALRYILPAGALN